MSYYGDTEHENDDIPRVELEASDPVKIKQIISCQWESNEGVFVVGLGEDGCVYRYDVRRHGWIAWDMRTLQPQIKRSR